MGDVCEVGSRKQSMIDQDSDPLLSIHLMLCSDSDIIDVNALGTSMITSLSFMRNRPYMDKRQQKFWLILCLSSQ